MLAKSDWGSKIKLVRRIYPYIITKLSPSYIHATWILFVITALLEYIAIGFANNACLMIEGASLTNLTGYISLAYLFYYIL